MAKEKKERTSKEKRSFKERFQKPKEDDGMDILTDVKEPFSFSGFFEVHVVERFRRAKNIMQEKGILFFLLSPFQARGRLIAELGILCIGILFGVIPRASTMMSDLQSHAYTSEIEGLKPQTVGSIRITPAASSHYKKVHMLAFVIEGKDLPSNASKYEVSMAKAYGASDWNQVTYSWSVYPADDSRRILLLAVDQSKQPSGYGAFQLFIRLADDEKISKYATENGTYEITLSTAQETTPLYDKTGIHLSALTESICGKGGITKAQTEFNDALKKYATTVEQAEAMPVDLTVAPTAEDLETHCLANRVYRTLKDDSTTEDILTLDPVEELPEITHPVIIDHKGISYDEAFRNELEGRESEEETVVFTAFDKVTASADTVTVAMENVNTAAKNWYDILSDYKLILNQTVQREEFPLFARCVERIDDPISFFDGEEALPEVDEETLHTTHTGDGTKKPVTQEPTVDEPVTEDPVTEEVPSGESKPQEQDAEEPAAYVPGTTPPPSADPADSK